MLLRCAERWAVSLPSCSSDWKKKTEETEREEREGDKMKKVWLWEEALYTFIHMVYQVHFQGWSCKIKTINKSNDMREVSANFCTPETWRKEINGGRLALMQKYAVDCIDGWAQCLPNSPVFSHVIWSWDGSRREGGRPSVCWKCCSQSTLLYQVNGPGHCPPPLCLCVHAYTHTYKT